MFATIKGSDFAFFSSEKKVVVLNVFIFFLLGHPVLPVQAEAVGSLKQDLTVETLVVTVETKPVSVVHVLSSHLPANS